MEIIKKAAVLLLVVVVLYWLFSDTYRRHIDTIDNDQTIRFAHFGSYQDFEFWREVIAAFNLHHPDTTISQEYVVGKSGHYSTKLRQQVMTDTLPDVFLIQLGPFPEFARFMENLDSFTHTLDNHLGNVTLNTIESPSELMPAVRYGGTKHVVDVDLISDNASGRGSISLDVTALDAFQYQGHQRALPISGGNLLIYLNLECLDRAASHHESNLRPTDDWTMDEFYQMAKHLTCDFDGDGAIDQFGFWLPRWIYYLPFMWSFGVESMDDDGHWQMTGFAAEQAFSFYQQLASGDRVCPRPDEVPQLFQDTGFLTGRTAMCVNGPWFQPFLDQTPLVNRYAVLNIPRGPDGRQTRITWDGVAMATGLSLARKRVVQQFIAYLLSDRVQAHIARLGRALPANTKALPKFRKSYASSRERFVKALDYSRLQPRWPHFSQLDRVVNQHLVRLIDVEQDFSSKNMLESLNQSTIIQTVFAPGK